MLAVNELTADDFLDKIVLPIKSFNVGLNMPWALRGVQHDFLLASDSFAHKMGLGNSKHIIGKDLNILPFIDDTAKSDLFNYDKKVIESKSMAKHVTVFNVNGDVLVRLITLIPIFFKGEVVAIDVPGNFVTQQHFDLNSYTKISSIKQSKNAIIQKDFLINASERRVIYLLLLGRTQLEIAHMLQISRSRVSKIIVEICERENIPGGSAKLIIDKAIAANYHKKIPPEFFLL